MSKIISLSLGIFIVLLIFLNLDDIGIPNVFITDLSITIKTLVDIKISSLKYTDHDATEEIKEKIRLKLEKHSFFVSKVLNAFPKLSGINSSIVADFRNRVNEFRKERRR